MDVEKHILTELRDIKKDLHELRKEVAALKIRVYTIAGSIAFLLTYAAKAL